MFDYHGRVAVITGGSSGLGVLCANALAARGCDVVLAARRFEILDKNAQALREQYGVKAIPVRCDVTKEDQVIAARELVEKEFGRCDILINCAGEGHNDWAIDLALEKWQATIDVCVTGLFLMCREFGKLMREHNYGARPHPDRSGARGQLRTYCQCRLHAWHDRAGQQLRPRHLRILRI